MLGPTIDGETEEEFVARLQRANVGERIARKVAADKFAHAKIAPPDPDAMRDALESKHEAEGDKLMLALGFEVVKLSQRRRSKVTEGVPDRLYCHRRRQLVLFWEAKAEKGTQRPDQRVFQEMWEGSGQAYVLGRLAELQAWLVAAGVATWDGPLLVPTPIAERAS